MSATYWVRIMRYRMVRLRRWDYRIKTRTFNAGDLRNALNQLDTSKDKLGLPDTIVEKTAYIYRKAQQRGLVQLEGQISAVIGCCCVSCL